MAAVQPKFVYGLRSDIKGNIHFLDTQDVIYPVAGVIAIHDFKVHKQTFLRLAENHLPTIIAISPNRKMLAISEWITLKQTCIINTYDISLLKKKKTFKLPHEVPNKDVAFMRFTEDSRGLAILSKEPNAFLTIFYFDKSETIIVGRVSNGNQTGLTADTIACNLSDTGLVAVAGRFTFKLMSRQDKSFGMIGTMTGEHKIVTSLVWLTAEILVAGTSADQLLFIESGDQKQNFCASTVQTLDLEKAKENDGDQSHLKLNPVAKGTYETDVNCLTKFDSGFCYTQHNQLFVFEKEKSYLRYKRRAIIKIPIRLYAPDSYKITNVSVNAQMDTVIVTTFHSQIYISKLFDPEMVTEQHLEFSMLGEPLHIASIVSMSICSWKPIIMTAAKDHTVRIWNYETAKVELVRKYQLEISALALHPTGLFVAVGFTDKMHLMEILLDTLKSIKSYDFNKCDEIVFSHQGHRCACAYDKLIKVISVFSFCVLGTLKGHNGKILSLAWSTDDNILVSSGSEGAIYQWSMTKMERIDEVVEKGTEFRSIALTQDNTIYVCTNKGIFREIQNSDIIREIDPGAGNPLTRIALARSDLMLFIGTQNGNLYNIQVPFLEAGGGTCTKYRFFSDAVSCMKITFDDKLLVIGSNDGTLIIWMIVNTEGKTAPIDSEHGKCTDIIVPRNDLIEKNEHIDSLEIRLNHQLSEHSFELEHVEKMHIREMQKTCEQYELTIKSLNEKRKVLEQKYYEERNLINAAIEQRNEAHTTEIIQIEAKLNEKILIESEKSTELKREMDAMKEDCEKQLNECEGKHQCTIETMKIEFREALDERDDQIRKLHDEIQTKQEEFYRYCGQLNLDGNRKLSQLKSDYETRQKETNDSLLKWRTDASILTKKIGSTSATCEQLRSDIATLLDEHNRNKKYISQLEQNITELQRDIDIQNKLLADKETCFIGAIERSNAMEKMKQFMNERAIKLEAKIQPLDEEIKLKNFKIYEIEELKRNLQCKIDDSNIEINLLRSRCMAITTDLKAEKGKNQRLETTIKRTCSDISLLAENIQNLPKLKELALVTFKKYLNANVKVIANATEIKTDENEQLENENGMTGTTVDKETATESRTKKRRKIVKQMDIDERYQSDESFDKTKLIKENLFLLSEMDKLKKSNRSMSERIYYLETIVKMPTKKS